MSRYRRRFKYPPGTQPAITGKIKPELGYNLLSPQNATRLLAKLSEASKGNGSNVIKVAGLGDSLTWHAMRHVVDKMVSEYGLKRGYGFGDGMNSFGVSWALEGGATYLIKTDYSISLSGNYWTIESATNDAVRFSPGTGGLFSNIDVLEIFYVAENGAGTFDIELSTTSTSSGFIKEGATIDANNGGEGILKKLSLSPSQGDYAIRIAGVSGNVRIAGIVAYDSTSDGIVMYDFGENSANPTSLKTPTDATWDTILAEDFDLLWFSYADSKTDQLTGLTHLRDSIVKASLSPDVLVVTPYPQSAVNVDDIAEAMRDRVLEDNLGWGFVDAHNSVGGDWGKLNDFGLGSDGIHPDSAISSLVAKIIYQSLQLPNALASEASDTTSDRTYANGVEIRETQTSINLGTSFSGGRGLTARAVVKLETNSPAGSAAIIGQDDVAGNERCFLLRQNIDGTLHFIISSDGTSSNFKILKTDGVIDLTYPREIVGVFNNAAQDIYIDGTLIPTSQLTASGSTVESLFDSPESVKLGQSSPTNQREFITQGTIYAATLLNKALSASEIQARYKTQNWTPSNERWGSPVPLTGGSLEIGGVYRIDVFVSGDDFTNVGASGNADNVTFTASGTAPTIWANGSVLQKVGAIFDLNMQLNGRQIADRSGRFPGLLAGTNKSAENVVHSNNVSLQFKGVNATSAIFLGGVTENDLLPESCTIETVTIRNNGGSPVSMNPQRSDGASDHDNLLSGPVTIAASSAKVITPDQDQVLTNRDFRFAATPNASDIDITINASI